MDEISLSDYIGILRYRKWTIGTMAVIALLLAGIYLAVSPKIFKSETTLLFPQKSSDGLSTRLARMGGLPMIGESVSGVTDRDTCIAVLKSCKISENVLTRLDLEQCGLNCSDLKRNLVVQPTKEGGLSIAFEVPTSWLSGHTPKEKLARETAKLSADIANTYVYELQRFDQSSSLFTGRKKKLFIEKQLLRAQDLLTAAENKLQVFQERHPTLIPPEKSYAYANEALEIASRQSETNVALQEVLGRIARAHDTWKKGAPQQISPESVIDSPIVANLQEHLAGLEVKWATLLEDVTEDHPDVVSISNEIEKTRSKINSEITQIIKGKAGSASQAHQELLKQLVLMEMTRDGLEARERALNNSMSAMERRMSALPPLELEYARLLREVKSAEVVYTTLTAELAKARVEEEKDSENFIVLDDAIVPDRPAKPKLKLTLISALMLGLIAGIALASAKGSPVIGKRLS